MKRQSLIARSALILGLAFLLVLTLPGCSPSTPTALPAVATSSPESTPIPLATTPTGSVTATPPATLTPLPVTPTPTITPRPTLLPTPMLTPVPTPEPRSAAVEEIMSKVTKAAGEVTSYSYTLEARATRRFGPELGIPPGDSSLTASGSLDLRAKQASYREVNVDHSEDQSGNRQEEQRVSEGYVSEGTVYSRSWSTSGEWAVENAGEQALAALNYLDWEMQLLSRARAIHELGEQSISGKDCTGLALELEPVEQLNVSILASAIEVIALEGDKDIEDLVPAIEKRSFEMWFDTETSNLARVYQYLKLNEPLDTPGTTFEYEWMWVFGEYASAVPSSPPEEAFALLIKDPGLSQEIRQALGKETGLITAADLQSLQQLDTRSHGIRDLSGLDYCTNLHVLEIRVDTPDISKLAALLNLTNLWLWTADDVDLTPLTVLPKLKSLTLDGSAIVDFTPLFKMTTLETLDLGWNPRVELAGLAALPNLRSLTCDGSKDVSQVGALTQLRDLSLSIPDNADVSVVASLTNLESLSLSGVKDVSLLASLSGLRRLNVKGRYLMDIPAIGSLTGLESLTLEISRQADFSPISNLTSLKYLDLSNHGLADLSVAEPLTSLETLLLRDNNVTDILRRS